MPGFTEHSVLPTPVMMEFLQALSSRESALPHGTDLTPDGFFPTQESGLFSVGTQHFCHFLSVNRGLGSSREKCCSVSQGACVLGLISPLIMLHWGNHLPFLGFSFPIYKVEALKPPGRVILFL